MRASHVALLLLAACGGSPDVHHLGARDAGRAAPPPSMSPTGDAGMATPAPAPSPSDGPDVCGNGLDDDGNGIIDDDCRCVPGAMQPCYPGDPADLAVGPCHGGTQTCAGAGEFGSWGVCIGPLTPSEDVCGDTVDQDCDGVADDGCPVAPPPAMGPTVIMVTVSLDGDCLTASCPAEAPYPVGCNIMMEGGDDRGCVASTPTTSEVYFQEGDACGAGHVSGTLSCSTEPGAGLDASDCMINKPNRIYAASSDGCPETWF